METLEQVADRIVAPEEDVTYRRADELHSALEIETLRGWRGLTKVDRIHRHVQVILDDGQCLVFVPGQTFKSRSGSVTRTSTCRTSPT
jgi:hypothetical protein